MGPTGNNEGQDAETHPRRRSRGRGHLAVGLAVLGALGVAATGLLSVAAGHDWGGRSADGIGRTTAVATAPAEAATATSTSTSTDPVDAPPSETPAPSPQVSPTAVPTPAPTVDPGPSHHQVITIHLLTQQLTATEDGVVVLTSPVTTGRPELPTPPGHYQVLTTSHPFLMRSDWPRSSPYWYSPTWVQYALWFRADGFAIHDASWRSAYGPGTQAHGSHGCVNVPLPAMRQLYRWAGVGTEVVVV